MTALTKLFIVLLVVCSLLLSASVVVFVNRVEDFKKDAEASAAAKKLVDQQLASTRVEKDSLQRQFDDLRTADGKEIADVTNRLTTEQNRTQELTSAAATAKVDAQMKETQLAGVTDALKSLEQANKDSQAQVADLRLKNAELLSKERELNITISQLSAQRDTVEAQRRNFSEQIAQLQAELTKYKDLTARNNLSLENPGAEVPNIDVKGVVKTVDFNGGVKYATISVGSSDNVVKNMKFYVINHATGEFLGVLTVSSVTPTEAFGRLDGPKLGQIVAGMEVKTQL